GGEIVRRPLKQRLVIPQIIDASITRNVHREIMWFFGVTHEYTWMAAQIFRQHHYEDVGNMVGLTQSLRRTNTNDARFQAIVEEDVATAAPIRPKGGISAKLSSTFNNAAPPVNQGASRS